MSFKSCLALVVLGGAGMAGAEPFRLPAVKLAAPPTIDGVVDAEEWRPASTFSGLVDTERREPAPENSEFWIGYDDKYIYFAARLEDKEPGKVTATERQQNASFGRDDHVGLFIGLGGHTVTYESFLFNAIGTSALSLAGGSAAKLEWQGEFEAKARPTATGWEGEARIPWQLLNLSAFKKGEVRFDVYRSIPRRTDNYSFARNPEARPEDTPIWDGVEPPAARHDTALYLLPYAYGGWDPDKGRLTNGGLDFKTELPGGLGITGTINPDFRNIEQSVLPLSFSRFEQLADETRPFFLEGSEYLYSNLFASQRISDFDLGFSVHGALSSRSNFGLFSTFDFGRNRSTVGQVSHRVTDEFSTNFSFSNLDTPETRNDAFSGGLSYSKGMYYASTSYSLTSDQAEGRGSYWAASTGYSDDRLYVGFDYLSISEDYLPALGYVLDTNYKGPSIFVSYNQPLAKGPIQRWSMNTYYSAYTQQNGEFHSSSSGVNGSIGLRNGIVFRGGTSRSRYFDDRDYSHSLGVSYPTFASDFSISLNMSEARFAGEPYRSWSGSASYRIGNKYSLSVSHQVQDYFGRRDQTVLGASAKLAIDQELGLRFIDRPDSANWYLTYRKSGGKGAEYFVILGDPSATEFRSSLIVKGIFPITIR